MGGEEGKRGVAFAWNFGEYAWLETKVFDLL